MSTRRPLLSLVRTRTFRSLRHRDYRIYFYGQLVSFTGSWMQSAALMWLAFDKTNDPLWPPLLLAAQVGPTLVFGPVGGYLADRLPKRAVILATQALFMTVAAGLTVVVAADRADPFLLLAVAAVNGIIQAIDLPARLAFVPDLIPKDDLINAVGLNSLLFNAARAVGPAVAGALFLLADQVAPLVPGCRPLTLGAAWCFLLNTISYAAVLFALGRIAGGRSSGSTKSSASGLDGLRYLRRNRPFAYLLILTGLFSTFAWPTLTLLPAYTKLVLGLEEKAYSLLVSGLGLGALVGAVVTATFGTVARRRRFLLSGAGCGLAGLTGLASVHAFLPAVGCCAAMGFGLILYLSTGQSAMQLAVPDSVRGRVMALWAMALGASAPVGHLLAGAAAQRYPVPLVLLTMAAGVAGTALGLTLLRFDHDTRLAADPAGPLVPPPAAPLTTSAVRPV